MWSEVMYYIKIENPAALTVKEFIKLLKTFNQDAGIAMQADLICGVEGNDLAVQVLTTKN